jgi:glycosyltransferase involved in cell wall biosynthesis
MSDSVHITVFLPVRNGIKYIERAVSSVLAQSYKNFKFIILDNNSTDGTTQFIKGLRDERVEKIYSNADLSIFESWHRIYKYAQADKVSDKSFLTTIGHDDIYRKDFLEIVSSLINESPGFDIYQTQFDIIDENDRVVRCCMPIPRMETARDFLLARCYGFRDSFGTGYVFRTSQYLKVGGFKDLPLLLWSDDLLVYRAIDSSLKVCSDRIAFSYRAHSSSASGSRSRTTSSAYYSALYLFLTELEQSDRKHLEGDEQVREGISILICRTLDRHRSLINNIPERDRLLIHNFVERYRLTQYPKIILAPLRPSYRKVLAISRAVVRALKIARC